MCVDLIVEKNRDWFKKPRGFFINGLSYKRIKCLSRRSNSGNIFNYEKGYDFFSRF